MQIHFKDIEHIIIETLDMGKAFKINPNGISMEPLIHQGRDSVYIKKPEGRLKKYDIAFFKRKNGEYVLHRVVKVKPDSYIFCGDNQWLLEKGITDSQIIGVVTKLEINGKTVTPDDADYIEYVRKRVGSRVRRNFFTIFCNFFKKIKIKLKRLKEKLTQ